MCGRGGVVGADIMTSQQVCVGSTGRRSPQGLENGLRALRRRAVRKTESPKVRRQKLRSFGEEGKGKEPKEGKAFHPGEKKAAWRKSGEWTWTSRTRSRVAKSWMSKKGCCRRSCEIGKPQEYLLQHEVEQWRPTSCQSTRRCRKGHKRYNVSRIKGERCREKMLQRKTRYGSSERMSSRKRIVSFLSSRNGSKNSGAAGRRKRKRQQGFASGGLLHGDDVGTVFRFGSRSGEVLFDAVC